MRTNSGPNNRQKKQKSSSNSKTNTNATPSKHRPRESAEYNSNTNPTDQHIQMIVNNAPSLLHERKKNTSTKQRHNNISPLKQIKSGLPPLGLNQIKIAEISHPAGSQKNEKFFSKPRESGKSPNPLSQDMTLRQPHTANLSSNPSEQELKSIPSNKRALFVVEQKKKIGGGLGNNAISSQGTLNMDLVVQNKTHGQQFSIDPTTDREEKQQISLHRANLKPQKTIKEVSNSKQFHHNIVGDQDSSSNNEQMSRVATNSHQGSRTIIESQYSHNLPSGTQMAVKIRNNNQMGSSSKNSRGDQSVDSPKASLAGSKLERIIDYSKEINGQVPSDSLETFKPIGQFQNGSNKDRKLQNVTISSYRKTKEGSEMKNLNSGRQITKVEPNHDSETFLALDYQQNAIIPSDQSLEQALGMTKSQLDPEDSINGDDNQSTTRKESRLRSIEHSSTSMQSNMMGIGSQVAKIRQKNDSSSLSCIAGRRFENKVNLNDTSHQRSTEMSMYAVDYYKKQQNKYIRAKKVYNQDTMLGEQEESKTRVNIVQSLLGNSKEARQISQKFEKMLLVPQEELDIDSFKHLGEQLKLYIKPPHSFYKDQVKVNPKHTRKLSQIEDMIQENPVNSSELVLKYSEQRGSSQQKTDEVPSMQNQTPLYMPITDSAHSNATFKEPSFMQALEAEDKRVSQSQLAIEFPTEGTQQLPMSSSGQTGDEKTIENNQGTFITNFDLNQADFGPSKDMQREKSETEMSVLRTQNETEQVLQEANQISKIQLKVQSKPIYQGQEFRSKSAISIHDNNYESADAVNVLFGGQQSSEDSLMQPSDISGQKQQNGDKKQSYISLRRSILDPSLHNQSQKLNSAQLKHKSYRKSSLVNVLGRESRVLRQIKRRVDDLSGNFPESGSQRYLKSMKTTGRMHKYNNDNINIFGKGKQLLMSNEHIVFNFKRQSSLAATKNLASHKTNNQWGTVSSQQDKSFSLDVTQQHKRIQQSKGLLLSSNGNNKMNIDEEEVSRRNSRAEISGDQSLLKQYMNMMPEQLQQSQEIIDVGSEEMSMTQKLLASKDFSSLPRATPNSTLYQRNSSASDLRGGSVTQQKRQKSNVLQNAANFNIDQIQQARQKNLKILKNYRDQRMKISNEQVEMLIRKDLSPLGHQNDDKILKNHHQRSPTMLNKQNSSSKSTLKMHKNLPFSKKKMSFVQYVDKMRSKLAMDIRSSEGDTSQGQQQNANEKQLTGEQHQQSFVSNQQTPFDVSGITSARFLMNELKDNYASNQTLTLQNAEEQFQAVERKQKSLLSKERQDKQIIFDQKMQQTRRDRAGRAMKSQQVTLLADQNQKNKLPEQQNQMGSPMRSMKYLPQPKLDNSDPPQIPSLSLENMSEEELIAYKEHLKQQIMLQKEALNNIQVAGNKAEMHQSRSALSLILNKNEKSANKIGDKRRVSGMSGMNSPLRTLERDQTDPDTGRQQKSVNQVKPKDGLGGHTLNDDGQTPMKIDIKEIIVGGAADQAINAELKKQIFKPSKIQISHQVTSKVPPQKKDKKQKNMSISPSAMPINIRIGVAESNSRQIETQARQSPQAFTVNLQSQNDYSTQHVKTNRLDREDESAKRVSDKQSSPVRNTASQQEQAIKLVDTFRQDSKRNQIASQQNTDQLVTKEPPIVPIQSIEARKSSKNQTFHNGISGMQIGGKGNPGKASFDYTGPQAIKAWRNREAELQQQGYKYNNVNNTAAALNKSQKVIKVPKQLKMTGSHARADKSSLDGVSTLKKQNETHTKLPFLSKTNSVINDGRSASQHEMHNTSQTLLVQQSPPKTVSQVDMSASLNLNVQLPGSSKQIQIREEAFAQSSNQSFVSPQKEYQLISDDRLSKNRGGLLKRRKQSNEQLNLYKGSGQKKSRANVQIGMSNEGIDRSGYDDYFVQDGGDQSRLGSRQKNKITIESERGPGAGVEYQQKSIDSDHETTHMQASETREFFDQSQAASFMATQKQHQILYGATNTQPVSDHNSGVMPPHPSHQYNQQAMNGVNEGVPMIGRGLAAEGERDLSKIAKPQIKIKRVVQENNNLDIAAAVGVVVDETTTKSDKVIEKRKIVQSKQVTLAIDTRKKENRQLTNKNQLPSIINKKKNVGQTTEQKKEEVEQSVGENNSLSRTMQKAMESSNEQIETFNNMLPNPKYSISQTSQQNGKFSLPDRTQDSTKK